jgi:hypothetical protein
MTPILKIYHFSAPANMERRFLKRGMIIHTIGISADIGGESCLVVSLDKRRQGAKISGQWRLERDPFIHL